MVKNVDCMEGLKGIDNDSIDLIYLDPPFFTQKIQKLTDKEGKQYCFNDRWDSINDYINYLKERLIECKRVLNQNGSIFLHCDNKASHYIKIMLDEVFGLNNFQSEIVWTYRRWSNSQKGLIPNHEIIFFYSKTKNFKFNTILTDYSATTNIDQIQQERVRNEKGKVVYKTDDNGDVVQSSAKNGVPISDVWEIPFLNPKAKERVGYPTQKPIELLERIILLASNENDVVLDPFCGSGTTLVAAKMLNRRFIGFDVNSEAIDLTLKRLEAPIKSTSFLLKKGKQAYINKTVDEENILKLLGCSVVQRNKGIDGFLNENIDGKPVCVKFQKDSETIEVTIQLLEHAMKVKNASYGVVILKKGFDGNIDSIEKPQNIKLISNISDLLINAIRA